MYYNEQNIIIYYKRPNMPTKSSNQVKSLDLKTITLPQLVINIPGKFSQKNLNWCCNYLQKIPYQCDNCINVMSKPLVRSPK